MLSIISCATRRRNHFNDWHFDSCELDSKATVSAYLEIKFFLIVNPDDYWYLELNLNGNYSYKHWNAYGSEKDQLLENGKYLISDNQLLLNPVSSDTPLKNKSYYIFGFEKDQDYECPGISCIKTDSLTYCLIQKF